VSAGLPNPIFAVATAQPDTWYHLAVVREGDLFSMYLDGILI